MGQMAVSLSEHWRSSSRAFFAGGDAKSSRAKLIGNPLLLNWEAGHFG
jgi:hypothetical protein